MSTIGTEFLFLLWRVWIVKACKPIQICGSKVQKDRAQMEKAIDDLLKKHDKGCFNEGYNIYSIVAL